MYPKFLILPNDYPVFFTKKQSLMGRDKSAEARSQKTYKKNLLSALW